MKASLTFAIALGASLFASASPAAVFIYHGTATGAQENPANASPGIGTATVTYDDIAHTLRVQTDFSGLLGTTTASHIHVGNGPGTNGGVATTTPTFPGFPLGVTAGSYDQSFDLTLASSFNAAFVTNNGGTLAMAEAALAAGLAAGKAYLNVHSTLFGGGEIRADLSAVPEPASWVMMLGGFGLLGAALRRRRVRVAFA